MHDFSTLVRDLEPELISLRHRLHRRPELGLQLPRTQEVLLQELAPLPLEISTGKHLTSITAVLRGGASSASALPPVLLRADMDGLPVDEAVDVEYRSANAGRMHACGHDLHMAMGIGAARLLCEVRSELAGDVVFMFQPGEEGHDGASYMIDEGVLDAAGTRVGSAFALHVFSSTIPAGRFASRPGTVMSASEDLHVRVVGVGGHGSAPHLANDPTIAVAEMISALQVMVTRRFDVFDPAVVTVGRIRAGHQRNVISHDATFDATVRTFSPQSRERIRTLVPRLLEGIASAHGLDVEIEWVGGYPLLHNDPAETEFARRHIQNMYGDNRFHPLDNPFSASEDFARVLDHVPGSFIALSAVPASSDHGRVPFNHSPKAVFDDSVIGDGAAVLASLALAKVGERDAAN